MATKRTNLNRNVSLLIISTGMILLASEAFLRAFFPTPYFGYQYLAPQRKLFQYDPVLGWRGRPNTADVFAKSDFYVFVTNDSNGYRNTTPEYEESKENVLILGDSYGWGWGVEGNEVFSSIIANTTKNMNVYNLSVPGYGTDQEFLTLKDFLTNKSGRAYTGVVLLFHKNDFEDNVANVRYSYPKPQFVLLGNDLVLDNVPVPELKKDEYNAKDRPLIRNQRSIFREIHLYNLIRYTMSRALKFIARLSRRGAPDNPAHQNSVMKTPLEIQYRQSVTLALLKEIAALAESNDMFFHVVMLKMTTMTETERRDMEQLEADLLGTRIETSSFQSRLLPNYHLWMDKHLSAYGHRQMSSHVSNIIRKNIKSERIGIR